MNESEKQAHGYGCFLMKGACLYLGKILLIGLLLMYFYCYLIQGVDDSDTSRWKRSGLKIHTDAKTGIQYLSDGKGGLIPRLTGVNGEAVIIRK